MKKNFHPKVCFQKNEEGSKAAKGKTVTIQEHPEAPRPIHNDICIKKEWFIQSKKDSVLKKYSFANILGEGAFGCVYKATLIGTDITRAIKVIRKEKVVEPSRLVTEINLMRQLDHPNLVKLYETYETEQEIYLVMEHCEGGELFSRIEGGKKMSEASAKEVFRDMAKAISYLHACNVCHRDLKPENFLFLDKKPDSTIKLTDFGLSTIVSAENKLKSMVGTAYYISPQVLESSYDISCDVWSLGVILIVLLTGKPPYEGEEDSEIILNIAKKNLIFPNDISPTAKNLISRCLLPTHKRITAKEILDHPWLIDKQRRSLVKKMDFKLLKQFSQASRLKKVVLTIIASQVKSKDIDDTTKLFKCLDVNSNGVLTQSQIRAGIKKSELEKHSEEELTEIIRGLDTDNNGQISYTQFMAAMIQEKVYLKEKYLKIAFDLIDKDGSGTIELEQLKELLMPEDSNNSFKQEQWVQMIKTIDKKSGSIGFQEFTSLLTR